MFPRAFQRAIFVTHLSLPGKDCPVGIESMCDQDQSQCSRSQLTSPYYLHTSVQENL